MTVPFLDLKAQHKSIRAELDAAIGAVIDSCAFAGGPFAEKFEKEFAEFCTCEHAISVGNGTDALWLILLALGIGSGDEVVTVPNTFIATTEAISLCGARPVLVDIDPATYTMNPEKLEQAISPRTRAIIPVHIFGQTAEMDRITGIADAAGIPVIEDACQAHGAEYRGKRAGSIGRAAAFSFYPGKNLGACGEAGAITTNDAEIAARARMFRDHGQEKKYVHRIVGWNARMDGIQGAILSVKLRHIDDWNRRRRENAAVYDELLSGVKGVAIPACAPNSRHVYHVYSVRVRARDAVMSSMKDLGVNCAIHYPIPIHLQKAYDELRLPKGSFPTAEQCADELLSLPMYPELGRQEITYVCDSLQKSIRRG